MIDIDLARNQETKATFSDQLKKSSAKKSGGFSN